MGGTPRTQERAVTAPETPTPDPKAPAQEETPPANADQNGKGKKGKGKGKRSVRDQGAGMKRNRPGFKAHKGGKGKAVNGRIPGELSAYLAAQLHQVRDQLIESKALVLEKAKLAVAAQKIALEKDEKIIELEIRLLQAEARTSGAENVKLREDHGLELTIPIHRDEKTGDVYYLESEIEADEKRKTDAAAKAAEAAKK